jgi:hypothetical protein
VLYTFSSYLGGTCPDGTNPFGNLVEDSAHNLYGTVKNGVFELSPDQNGEWSDELICADNSVQGGLAIDDTYNLYGVDADFVTGVGNVFKI